MKIDTLYQPNQNVYTKLAGNIIKARVASVEIFSQNRITYWLKQNEGSTMFMKEERDISLKEVGL